MAVAGDEHGRVLRDEAKTLDCEALVSRSEPRRRIDAEAVAIPGARKASIAAVARPPSGFARSPVPSIDTRSTPSSGVCRFRGSACRFKSLTCTLTVEG